MFSYFGSDIAWFSKLQRVDNAIVAPMLAGLRDRAQIALMVYSFAGVGATLAMWVDDVYKVEPPAVSATARTTRRPISTVPARTAISGSRCSARWATAPAGSRTRRCRRQTLTR